MRLRRGSYFLLTMNCFSSLRSLPVCRVGSVTLKRPLGLVLEEITPHRVAGGRG